MKRTLIVLATAALLVGAIAQTGRSEFESRMNGVGKGKASWKTRDSATQFQAQLEVEGERLPKNAVLNVRVLNDTWPSASDAFGKFHLTKRFNTSTRPAIAAGTPITVFAGDGSVLLSGTFSPK